MLKPILLPNHSQDWHQGRREASVRRCAQAGTQFTGHSRAAPVPRARQPSDSHTALDNSLHPWLSCWLGISFRA